MTGKEEYDRLMAAAHNVWAWVGPGDPDRFMRDVLKLAAVYFSLQKSQVAPRERQADA